MYATKAGNVLPIMQITTDADLTGVSFTAIRWRRVDIDDAAATEGTVGNLVLASADPTDGSVVEYTFAAGETDTPGEYEGEVDVEDGGNELTIPGFGFFRFRIRAKLA